MRIARNLYMLSAGFVALALSLSAGAESSFTRALSRYESRWSFDARPIGGSPEKISSSPWQVSLVWSAIPNNFYAHHCGGSWISKEWIATAAHCLDDVTDKATLDVVWNDDFLADDSRNRLAIIDRVQHPKYAKGKHPFDVALIRVARTDGATPIPLLSPAAEKQFLSSNPLLKISGWGDVRPGEQSRSRQLLSVSGLPIVSYIKCTKPDAYSNTITDDMLCVGKEGGSQGACNGDSGGPASSVVNERNALVAIVSWADEFCGDPKKYGVYSRVSYPEIYTWIMDRLR